MFSLILCC